MTVDLPGGADLSAFETIWQIVAPGTPLAVFSDQIWNAVVGTVGA